MRSCHFLLPSSFSYPTNSLLSLFRFVVSEPVPSFQKIIIFVFSKKKLFQQNKKYWSLNNGQQKQIFLLSFSLSQLRFCCTITKKTLLPSHLPFYRIPVKNSDWLSKIIDKIVSAGMVNTIGDHNHINIVNFPTNF